MKSKKHLFQLYIMMLMQYFIFAVWWVPFAAYLSHQLQLEVFHILLILCAMAVGSMASPFVGFIADCRFPAQKGLAVLNLLTAVMLFFVTQQTAFPGLIITVTLVMLCYMPTWSLTGSIAMTHVSAEQFPRMRLMGTIGWVASGIFSLTAEHIFKVEIFDGTSLPLYCGAFAGLIAAAMNLFLPDIPPVKNEKKKISMKDIFGLKTVSTIKSKNFNIFILISFLTIIPFTLYHVYGSMFFADEQVKNITLTMNWGQVVEMLFLFIATGILIKFGFRKNTFVWPDSHAAAISLFLYRRRTWLAVVVQHWDSDPWSDLRTVFCLRTGICRQSSSQENACASARIFNFYHLGGGVSDRHSAQWLDDRALPNGRKMRLERVIHGFHDFHHRTYQPFVDAV